MNKHTQLKDWIGHRRSATDVVTAWPLAALAATLDRRDPEPRAGDAVPPGWHWLYFLETSPASELGADGHPRRGDFPVGPDAKVQYQGENDASRR